jgi:hypothetical protein
VGTRLSVAARLAALLPSGLALLLLGAHFFRAGLLPLTALCVGLTGALLVPSPVVARVLQAVLWLGVAEWLRTAWILASARAAAGLPYGRLLVILGAVAAATAVAALLLRSRPARRHFRYGPGA